MRIIGKNNLQSGQPGTIQLIVDNAEELWDLYNILEVGDSIRLATSRKVQHDTGSKTTSFKKTITITLKIEDIEFSPNSINIKGKNISENEYIKIGQYQTDEIVVNTTFTLSKNYWDDIHLETLKKITDIRVMSEIVAILMEAGIANLFYITSNQTVSKGKITQSVPKKKAYSKHDAKENKFFNKILNQFIKQINFENTKVLIIAGPGTIKEDFKKYLDKTIESNPKDQTELKTLLNKKIIYTESSSGFKHSLLEILSKPNIKALIKDTKCVDDVSVLEKFNEIKGLQPDKLFFGYKSFDIAYKNFAIDTLIVTDGYIRKLSALVRKDLSEKIKDLKLNKIKVCQFSSMHFTGESIDEFGGICGILKYVVEEISELGNEENTEEKEEKDTEKGNKNENSIKINNDNKKNTKKETKENKKEDKKEGKKEDKKEEKGNNKKKNVKENNKNISKQSMPNKRKKNAYDEEEDYEDYDEEEDYYYDDEYDDEDYYYKRK